jgi:hypothetical protein
VVLDFRSDDVVLDFRPDDVVLDFRPDDVVLEGQQKYCETVYSRSKI